MLFDAVTLTAVVLGPTPAGTRSEPLMEQPGAACSTLRLRRWNVPGTQGCTLQRPCPWLVDTPRRSDGGTRPRPRSCLVCAQHFLVECQPRPPRHHPPPLSLLGKQGLWVPWRHFRSVTRKYRPAGGARPAAPAADAGDGRVRPNDPSPLMPQTLPRSWCSPPSCCVKGCASVCAGPRTADPLRP